MFKSPQGALDAYKKNHLQSMSGRDVEAAVLTKAALALKKCKDNWDADDRNAKLREALKFNQRIWSIFQGDLIKKSNPLPRRLKQNILNLSIFIDKRIIEILVDPEPEKLTAIIDINLNLAAGLRGSSVPEDREDDSEIQQAD